LAERLSQIPKSISPTPIFRQMEKLEQTKLEIETRLADVQSDRTISDKPITYDDFASFRKALNALLERENDPIVRAQIIEKLISRVDVSPTEVTIHFHVGKNHLNEELGGESSPPKIKKLLDPSLKNNGSNSLSDLGHR